VTAAVAAPPKRSQGPAPVRAAGSVRRTSSLEVSWPEGRGGRIHVSARARDLLTPRAGTPRILAEDAFEARVALDGTLETIAFDPPRPALAWLAGKPSRGGFRRTLAEKAAEERQAGTPLYLILDDMPGAVMISPWAWSQFDVSWIERLRERFSAEELIEHLKRRRGVCIGHANSSPSDLLSGRDEPTPALAAPLARPEDPAGWHGLANPPGAGLRRARRIDVTLGETIQIDAEFQDSGARPDGERTALHEYGLVATADPVSLRLLSLEATARVLPNPDCPAAVRNIQRLVGTPLPDLRQRVLDELAGTAGCTHLNDAIRALAEVPALVGALAAA